MKKHLLLLSLASLILCNQIVSADNERMMPIKDTQGNYFYDEQDTHVHIDLVRALQFLRKKLFSFSSMEHEHFEPTISIAPFPMPEPTQTIPDPNPSEPTIVWIGHSTFLIQINGFNILTDPIFDAVKVGPLTITKRNMLSGIAFEDLPPIDAIVISHNHSDHTDTTTLMALAQKYDPVIYVPENNKELFASMGFTSIVESTWWENHTLTKNDRIISISCLPALHWSIRFSLSGYRKSLWASWMVYTDDKHIYFAGDTAYGKHFKQIQDEFPKIDIALMPIGPTHDGENKHKHSHVDAREAVDAFIDLDAHCFIPMHYGTFFKSRETSELPLAVLHEYWQGHAEQLMGKNLLVARCGEPYEFN